MSAETSGTPMLLDSNVLFEKLSNSRPTPYWSRIAKESSCAPISRPKRCWSCAPRINWSGGGTFIAGTFPGPAIPATATRTPHNRIPGPWGWASLVRTPQRWNGIPRRYYAESDTGGRTSSRVGGRSRHQPAQDRESNAIARPNSRANRPLVSNSPTIPSSCGTSKIASPSGATAPKKNTVGNARRCLGKLAHTLLETQIPQSAQSVDEALRRNHYWEGEVIHKTKNGDRIVVASRRVLQMDAGGQPAAIFEINNDVTDRKNAEEALRQSEQRLRSLFEFSPDAIVVTARDGKITDANAQLEKFFGYRRSELMGLPIEVLIPERFRAEHPKRRADYAAQPRVRSMGVGLELYGRRKDGTEFPVDIMLGPMEGAEGALVLGVIRDLSQKKKDEEALRLSQQQKLYLEEELQTGHQFDEIVGESPGLKRVLKQVEDVASTDATVLILGETGTGKELIARAIHQLSPRRDHAFVKLNCSAIPSGLLESELFGHEKGAFTGAIAQKIGRLELAHQGTFFLDEVGDLPPELQPKILRALQEKEFERVGRTRTIPVNVRLVAATNRDLAKMVAAGNFAATCITA